jgi:hypothetical protein
MSLKESFPVTPSMLEHIDEAMFLWLQDKKLSCVTNTGFKFVDVIWAGPERAFATKRIPNKGVLVLPLITLERTGTNKDLSKVGAFAGYALAKSGYDPRGGNIAVAYRINHEKTSNFANADSAKAPEYGGHLQPTFPRINKKVVYEVAYIPMPIYVLMTYVISLRTEYQEQMNQLLQPFVAVGERTNYFVVTGTNGHRYECFIKGDFDLNNNVANMGTEDSRNFETKITIEALGYTIGAGDNEEGPRVAVHETAAEFKFMRERTIMGDEIEHGPPNRKPGIEGGYRT